MPSRLAAPIPAPLHPARPEFVADSPSFRRALVFLERFARHRRLPVLIEGESGTGKSYFARHLHLASPRAERPFHVVDLAALDDNLAGGDLFGHVAGAYTDARRSRGGQLVEAQGGTLFLDEIGKASPGVQRRLLTVVETGVFRPLGADRAVMADVRLVAASNVPLAELVAQDRFLPDLLARFGCCRVRIPALRERRKDIPGLVAQSLARHAADFDYAAPPEVHPRLLAALVAAEWRYNLRELDATMQGLLLHAEGARRLTLAHCEGDLDHLRRGRRAARARRPAPAATSVEASTREAFDEAGTKAGAARILGIHRTTVHRRLGSDKPGGAGA